MSYIDKSYLTTQFTNFATRVAAVFAKKSEIPTVNDAKLTIKKNGNTAGSFSANSASDVEVDLNDLVLFSAQALTEEQKAQVRTNIGAGSVESVAWKDITDTPTTLEGYGITDAATAAQGAEADTAVQSVKVTGDETEYKSGTSVVLPAFIQNTVDNLVNYYTKTDTYTKTEVDNAISAATSGRFLKVDALPTEDIKTNVIYLVLKSPAGESGNIYNEYINLDGTTAGWELIGDTQISLEGYLKDSDAELKYVQISATETENIDFSKYFE